MKSLLTELAIQINDSFVEFKVDMVKSIQDGDNAAGARARKSSKRLEKLMKEYRKESVK